MAKKYKLGDYVGMKYCPYCKVHTTHKVGFSFNIQCAICLTPNYTIPWWER